MVESEAYHPPMVEVLADVAIGASLLVAAWGLLTALRGIQLTSRQRSSMLVLTGLFVVLAIVGIVQMIMTERDFARLEFVGYLFLTPVISLGAWWWVKDDKTRIASIIYVVVGLTMAFLAVRIEQVFTGV